MAIPGEFFFAWIDEPVPFDEAVHAVKDEKIIWLNRILAENDFPNLSITIEKPSDELLAPGRKRWAWVSYSKMDGTVVPLYLGWLHGLPENMTENVITILFTSRPVDFAEQKIAVAAGMKSLPDFDLAFIKIEDRDDPDIILQSRPMVWHMSHLYPLTVSVSHLVNGEDGHVTFQSGAQVDYASVSRSLGKVPLRKVKMTAEAFWLQSATGEVDCKIPLLKAAKEAGTNSEGEVVVPDGVVTSYTGQGLADDTPRMEDRIGSGWWVKSAEMIFLKREEKEVRLKGLPITFSFTGSALDPMLSYLRSLSTIPGNAIFHLWHLVPNFTARYDVSRRRQEILTFTLEADIQPIQTDPGDEEVLEMSVSTVGLHEPLDEGGTVPPIVDVRRAAYFSTTRGQQSLQFLIDVAGAQIVARARCVEIEFKVPFELGIDITCRMNATLVDPRFPGGALGKVVSTSLLADPNNGEFSCTITIACSVGEGNTVTVQPGEALYIDDDYIDESYYVRSGETLTTAEGNVTYDDFSHITPNDDGADFFSMDYNQAVLSATLVNGQLEQEAVLDSQIWEDIGAAVDALVVVPTEYQLVMKPLEGSFVTEYEISMSKLMVAKTYDAGAVA